MPRGFSCLWLILSAKSLWLAPDTDLLLDPVLRSLQGRYLRTLAKFGGRYLPGDLHFPSLIMFGKTFGLAPNTELLVHSS